MTVTTRCLPTGEMKRSQTFYQWIARDLVVCDPLNNPLSECNVSSTISHPPLNPSGISPTFVNTSNADTLQMCAASVD